MCSFWHKASITKLLPKISSYTHQILHSSGKGAVGGRSREEGKKRSKLNGEREGRTLQPKEIKSRSYNERCNSVNIDANQYTTFFLSYAYRPTHLNVRGSAEYDADTRSRRWPAGTRVSNNTKENEHQLAIRSNKSCVGATRTQLRWWCWPATLVSITHWPAQNSAYVHHMIRPNLFLARCRRSLRAVHISSSSISCAAQPRCRSVRYHCHLSRSVNYSVPSCGSTKLLVAWSRFLTPLYTPVTESGASLRRLTGLVV